MKTIPIRALAVLIVGGGLALLWRGGSGGRESPAPSCHRAHGRGPARHTSPADVNLVAECRSPTCPASAWSALSSTTPRARAGPAPPCPLGFHLRVRPVGPGPEPGR